LCAGLQSVFPAPRHTGLPAHTAFTAGSQVVIGPAVNQPMAALQSAADILRGLRRALGAERNHTQNNTPVGEDFLLASSYRTPPRGALTAPQGSAFGLPHNYQFTSGFGPRTLNFEVFAPGDPTGPQAHGSARRASAVFFKVLKIAGRDGGYVPLVAYLPAAFLGAGYSIKLNRCVDPRADPKVWDQRPVANLPTAAAIDALFRNGTTSMVMDLNGTRSTEPFVGLPARPGWQVVWP